MGRGLANNPLPSPPPHCPMSIHPIPSPFPSCLPSFSILWSSNGTGILRVHPCWSSLHPIHNFMLIPPPPPFPSFPPLLANNRMVMMGPGGIAPIPIAAIFLLHILCPLRKFVDAYYVQRFQQQQQQKCGLDFKWSCGATDSPFTLSLTEQMACQVATPLCPRTLNTINNCCLQHDACYSARLGQAYCDEIFCQCLCVTKWDGPVCAMRVGCGFCMAVRLFGGLVYIAGGHK